MAVKSWPYVSIENDRDVTASDEAQGYDLFVGAGIVPGVWDELIATKVSGTLQLSMAAGAAIIAGRRYVQDAPETINIDAGDAQPRIDIIAMESNANTDVRAARWVVVKGTPAASPSPPSLTNTAAIAQFERARVTVPASAASLDSATLINATVYASGRHNHSVNDVTGIQTQIDSLQSQISGKANASHTHSIANVTGLSGALDGKSNTSHTHDSRYYTESEIDSKLGGKANVSHTHTIANVTGLQTALNGKQDSLNTDQRRKITISTSNPSGGVNGDIWLKY